MPAPTPVTPLDAEQLALVGKYEHLVRKNSGQVGRKLPPSFDWAELMSVGRLALCEAARRYRSYCESRGFDSTGPEADRYIRAYLDRRVKGAMLDYLRSLDTVSRSGS